MSGVMGFYKKEEEEKTSRKKREEEREEISGKSGALLSFRASHISLRAKLKLQVWKDESARCFLSQLVPHMCHVSNQMPHVKNVN